MPGRKFSSSIADLFNGIHAFTEVLRLFMYHGPLILVEVYNQWVQAGIRPFGVVLYFLDLLPDFLIYYLNFATLNSLSSSETWTTPSK